MLKVSFKSVEENFIKEEDGRKPNTFRKVDNEDTRFIALRNGTAKFIEIVMVGREDQRFEREITDYTEWKGWGIISWKVKP